jgi:Family of unknown function (DUF6247)
MSEGCVSSGFMGHLSVSGDQPVVPLPEREPAAIRAAVARLDPAALARFEADWTAATARARDEYSLLPARYFVEHWFNWVAVARWPELATRLRACERIVAESPDRAQRREAAAEISQILRRAETIISARVSGGYYRDMRSLRGNQGTRARAGRPLPAGRLPRHS